MCFCSYTARVRRDDRARKKIYIYAEWLFVADCIFLARQTNPIHLSGQWSSPEGRNYVDDDDDDSDNDDDDDYEDEKNASTDDDDN